MKNTRTEHSGVTGHEPSEPLLFYDSDSSEPSDLGLLLEVGKRGNETVSVRPSFQFDLCYHITRTITRCNTSIVTSF